MKEVFERYNIGKDDDVRAHRTADRSNVCFPSSANESSDERIHKLRAALNSEMRASAHGGLQERHAAAVH
jgi:hypothetical protein